MQRIIITGGVGRDPELRSTQAGDQVCAVSVGVTQGWGENKQTNWYRCNVWGKRAATVADHLRKGMKVTVIGELSIGEYQGKPQYDVRVDDIDWQPAKRDDTAQQERAYGAVAERGGLTPADLDDDVPF